MTNKEAIEILCDQIKGNKSEAMQMALKALCEPNWIPCSERLPENTKRVLVAFDSEDDDDEERIWTQIGEYHAKVGGWTVDGWIERASPETFCRVLAWMPLPEPYKKGDAE